MGRTWKHVKNPLNLTLGSKVNVLLGSWTYATYRFMMIHPCAKDGKPMSNQNKVMGRTRICTDRRTDRQTDRRTKWFLYTPWTSFTDGIIKMCAIDSLRKFDFRKMTINGKEMENFEKKIDEKWRYDHFFC